jgi:aminopeptidase N
MEYPTLITGRARWIAPEDVLDPEDVVVHEFAHQYWYGMVASNEFEDPWLDEGFTTYSEIRLMERVYGYTMNSFRIAGGIPLFGVPMLTLDGFPLIAVMDKVRVHYQYDGRIRFLQNVRNDPMAKWGFKQYDLETYITNAYDKPALMLLTLEKILGEKTMEAILRTYFQRYRFGHPMPRDFYAVVDEVSGRDMRWFFRQIVDETLVLDYGVESLKSTMIDGNYRHEVLLRRYGEMRMPVDIRLTCENGETVNDTWDGNDRWTKKIYTTGSRAIVVQVDPDNILVLDVDIANNSKKADTDHRAVLSWTSKWLFWMQHLLQFLSCLS